MKILTVLGARPQFIKATTVSRAIKNTCDMKEIIVHTGQHYDANMSEVFFKQLEIPTPHFNLEVADFSHGVMTGRMMEKIEDVIIDQKPDCVLVYGDTNSTLAGALSAVKLHVPVAHVEAGLRSQNLAMPEEINRVLTDRVSSILFCPSKSATSNLRLEGYPFTDIRGKKQKIMDVGDVMYDASIYYKNRAIQEVSLKQWNITENNYVLCTLHRAENTDDVTRLKSIFYALKEISCKLPIILPLHPRTKKIIDKLEINNLIADLNIIDPVPYLEMQRLLIGSNALITDSGGLQKEAYFHDVPCITLRDETEWMETVTAGWNQLVGANKNKIVSAFQKAKPPYAKKKQLYGDGMAAYKIVEALKDIK